MIQQHTASNTNRFREGKLFPTLQNKGKSKCHIDVLFQQYYSAPIKQVHEKSQHDCKFQKYQHIIW